MNKHNKPNHTIIDNALASCRVMVKFVLLFGFLVNLLMLSTPLFSMQVLDRVIGSQSLETLVMLLLVIILALALLSLIQAARSFAMNKLGTWFENKLSEVVLSNSFKQSLESRLMANSQALRDLQTVKNFLTSQNLVMIMDMPWALIFISVLFVLHVKIGCLAIISIAVLILFGIVADRATKPMIEMNNDNFVKSMRCVEQSTRNAEVIEAMGMRKNVIDSWQVLNQEVQQTQNLLSKRQIVFGEITKFFRLIIQISVTALGAYLVIQGQLSTGAIIASSSLVGRALVPFEAAINSWKVFVNCCKSYERLKNALLRYSEDTKKMQLPIPQGKIDIENLYYAPMGTQKHILKGINFSLDAGEVLAIIGPSASGKTTLAKLLVGAYVPNIGSVRIDGASLRDWRKDDLGKYLGYLSQDACLFMGTIKDNIARMNSNPDHKDVIVASQLAGVHDMILQLPQGYNSNIGFDGAMLSGGQKQRVGLARAFYGDPKFIVLDEPNASLDIEGEKALMTAIAVAKEKRITTVIISHKNSILSCVDKILILKDGMMASFGSKKDILDKIQKSQANGNTQ